MAAPHVTGVIGLMLSAGIPSNQVLNILHRTSMPLDGDSVSLFYGHGLINAYWAVNAVDKMRIVVGTRTGDLVEAIAEASVNPNGGNFEFTDLPREITRSLLGSMSSRDQIRLSRAIISPRQPCSISKAVKNTASKARLLKSALLILR